MLTTFGFSRFQLQLADVNFKSKFLFNVANAKVMPIDTS